MSKSNQTSTTFDSFIAYCEAFVARNGSLKERWEDKPNWAHLRQDYRNHLPEGRWFEVLITAVNMGCFEPPAVAGVSWEIWDIVEGTYKCQLHESEMRELFFSLKKQKNWAWVQAALGETLGERVYRVKK